MLRYDLQVNVSEPSDFRFDPEVHPRKLNLGCGFDLREGYLNVDFQDFHGPDLVGDVRALPMLPSDTFDEILAIDVLEHLPRNDTVPALNEWARLLRSGGSLTLQMPDVVACGRFLVTHDNDSDHQQLLGQLFGTQGYTGDFHLAGFTDITLSKLLHDAGFRSTVIETRDGWMLRSSSQLGSDATADFPISLGWLAGFWGLETAEHGAWRWCAARAELLLFNHSSDAVRIEVSAGIGRSPGSGAEVSVSSSTIFDAFTDVVQVDGIGETPWSRALLLEPGATRLIFSTDAAALDVPDARTLAFRLTNPGVTIL